MPQITVEQLQSWIGTAFWPFVRIGACLMIAPVFGSTHVPRRLRLLLSLVLTIAILPLLPPHGGAALLSADGIVTTVQQLLIGAALGFMLQLMFDALVLGGQLLANGMGLGFAFNIDPLRGESTPVLGQLYLVIGILIFLALDGHIALLQTLVGSFQGLPVGTQGLAPERLLAIANWGSTLFSGALRVALPGVTAMLVINLAFGVTSRAAPSLNLFAIGFPISLVFGLVILLLGLPALQSGMSTLLLQTFGELRALVAAG